MNKFIIGKLGIGFVAVLLVAGTLAFSGAFITAWNASNVRTAWEASAAAPSAKPRALNTLQKEVGYGGFIDEYRSFILRPGDVRPGDVRMERVYLKLRHARSAISHYRTLGLNDAEMSALLDIESTVEKYASALKMVAVRAGQGQAPSEIEGAVTIDDGPALAAFDTLTREIDLANKRNSNRVEEALASVLLSANATAWMVLTGTLFLIGYASWIFRYHFIRPINRMSRLITLLTKGDMGLNVHANEQTDDFEEMAHAVEDFKDTAIERMLAEKLRDEFISTVSHELRTPLTSIKGALGLIRSGTVGEISGKLKSLIEIAYNNSDRLVRMISDILDVDKIAAGKMEFRMGMVNLGDLLEQAVAANKSYGEGLSADFQLTNRVPIALVRGDQDRIMQVLANLLSNAVKYSPQDKPIEISLASRGDGYRVTVADHGPGIPPEFHDKIFDRFSQADTSDTRQNGGTGLGLNIAKEIVERHGGTIGFQSVDGRGATFYVDLPQWKGSPPRPTGPQV